MAEAEKTLVVNERPVHRTRWAAQFAVASELCKKGHQARLRAVSSITLAVCASSVIVQLGGCTQPTTGQNSLGELSAQLKEVRAGVPPSSDPLVAWCTEHSPSDLLGLVNASRVENCVTDRRRHDEEAEVANVPQQEAAEAAQQQYDANVARAKQQGYQPISFDDFKLDGKQLAVTHAKLFMRGFYKKFGGVETLQPTGLAVAIAREYGNDSGIPLLTEDASRNLRKILLQCGDSPAVPLGCPLTIVGHADMCTKTNLVGSKNAPCVAVEDGW